MQRKPILHKKGGFTIIELMIATVILAMITGVVYTSFFSVTESIGNTRDAVEQINQQVYLTRHFQTNFSQTFSGWQPGAAYRPWSNEQEPIDIATPEAPIYWFEHNNDTGIYGDADSITFATSAPLQGYDALPGHFKQVTYDLVDRRDLRDMEEFFQKEGIESTMMLQVSEVPLMTYSHEYAENSQDQIMEFPFELMEDLEKIPPGWVVPVRTLNFRFYDGEEWLDQWEMDDFNRLPWAIEITAEIEKPSSYQQIELRGTEITYEFFMRVPLPTGIGVFNDSPTYGRMPFTPGNPGVEGR
jgi:prepilin-type N-terminal cleavage/methylation domain-containing protein